MAHKKHHLFLNIPDVSNEQVLVIEDISLYTTFLDVDCPTLEVTSPGFKLPVEIEFTPGGRAVLNACTLGIVRTGCDENPPVLQDGLYKIRYSVSPNDLVWVYYEHLRITHCMNVLNKIRCSLNVSGCEPQAEVKRKMMELFMVEEYIKTAKAVVEDCHDTTRGLQIFQYGYKWLMKLQTGCSTC